jgi:peroxiredoxin
LDNILIVNAVVSWIVILINFLLILALIRRFNASYQSGVVEQGGGQRSSPDLLAVGQVAPNFTAETFDGKTVDLSTLTSPICLLTFISSTCSPCKELVRHLDRLQPTLSSLELGLTLIGIDSVDGLRQFVDETKTSFPVVHAPQSTNSLAQDYKIHGTPTVYVLDSDRKVKWAGFPDLSSLDQLLSKWAA